MHVVRIVTADNAYVNNLPVRRSTDMRDWILVTGRGVCVVLYHDDPVRDVYDAIAGALRALDTR